MCDKPIINRLSGVLPEGCVCIPNGQQKTSLTRCWIVKVYSAHTIRLGNSFYVRMLQHFLG